MKHSLVSKIGNFRLLIAANICLFACCFLSCFAPHVAFYIGLFWLLSIVFGAIFCLGETVDFFKGKSGIDSRTVNRKKKRLIVSILMYVSVVMSQGPIGMAGAWTRVMMYGGSNDVRMSMFPLFDQYPVDMYDSRDVPRRLIRGNVNWAASDYTAVMVVVRSDSIHVFPRFPIPLRGGHYLLMKDPDDRPETDAHNVLCVHFGYGLWFLLNKDRG